MVNMALYLTSNYLNGIVTCFSCPVVVLFMEVSEVRGMKGCANSCTTKIQKKNLY